MACARGAGSSDLKTPEPTNTPSAPSCIMRAASAGVATPPAAKLTTGSRPSSRAGGADGGGNALQGHDGAGAGLLRDPGVLRRDDVHDDAALQHLGKAALDGISAGFDSHWAEQTSRWNQYRGDKREGARSCTRSVDAVHSPLLSTSTRISGRRPEVLSGREPGVVGRCCGYPPIC